MNIFTFFCATLPCFAMAAISNSYIAKFMSERRKKLLWTVAIIGTVLDAIRIITGGVIFPSI